VAGLPAVAQRETAERARFAIRASGFDFPKQRIHVTVEPALPKASTGLDLAIALAILWASGQVEPADTTREWAWVGELSLTGQLRSVSGLLAFAEAAAADGRVLALPDACERLVAHWGKATVCGAISLGEAVDLFGGESIGGQKPLSRTLVADEPLFGPETLQPNDWAAIAQIKAAIDRGARGVLLTGAAASGKTRIASRVKALLGTLDEEQAREVAVIRDAAGLLVQTGVVSGELTVSRPFRAPHHTVSVAGLTGNASTLRPGEVTLAHHGVLFLDEAPEFSRSAIDVLGAALDNAEVNIIRANVPFVSLPAKPAFVIAAANCCPCGNAGSDRPCACSPESVERFNERLRWLRNRLRLHTEVEVGEPIEDPLPRTVVGAACAALAHAGVDVGPDDVHVWDTDCGEWTFALDPNPWSKAVGTVHDDLSVTLGGAS